MFNIYRRPSSAFILFSSGFPPCLSNNCLSEVFSSPYGGGRAKLGHLHCPPPPDLRVAVSRPPFSLPQGGIIAPLLKIKKFFFLFSHRKRTFRPRPSHCLPSLRRSRIPPPAHLGGPLLNQTTVLRRPQLAVPLYWPSFRLVFLLADRAVSRSLPLHLFRVGFFPLVCALRMVEVRAVQKKSTLQAPAFRPSQRQLRSFHLMFLTFIFFPPLVVFL